MSSKIIMISNAKLIGNFELNGENYISTVWKQNNNESEGALT